MYSQSRTSFGNHIHIIQKELFTEYIEFVILLLRNMANIQEQIPYWKNGAMEDVAVASELISGGRHRHGLFFAHLALEKILKAHICKRIQKPAPRVHNLIRLAEIAEISLSETYHEHLADMNEFNLEGRYPIQYIDTVSDEEATGYLKKTKEVLEWLAQQL